MSDSASTILPGYGVSVEEFHSRKAGDVRRPYEELALHAGEVRLVRSCYSGLKPDEVLIATLYAGICGSDRNWLKLSAESVQGHEAVGVTLACGDKVRHLKPKDKVVLLQFLPCKKCRNCLSGNTRSCTARLHPGKMFTPFQVQKQEFVLNLPDGDADLLKYVLAEPLAGVLGAVRCVDAAQEAHIALFGGGAAGVLFAYAYRERGRRVITIIERSESKRAKLAALRIADEVVDPVEVKRESADLAIHCNSDPASFKNALEAVRPGGEVVLFSEIMGAGRMIEELPYGAGMIPVGRLYRENISEEFDVGKEVRLTGFRSTRNPDWFHLSLDALRRACYPPEYLSLVSMRDAPAYFGEAGHFKTVLYFPFTAGSGEQEAIVRI